MRDRVAVLCLAAALLCAGAAPAAAADVVAITGTATSVGTMNATLNCIALPARGGSSWEFQYGPSTAYGEHTAPLPLAAGLTALTERVTGLAAATSYHYRLIVLDGETIYGTGSDQTFTTTDAPAVSPSPVGARGLSVRQVRVVRGRAVIRLACPSSPGTRCPRLLALRVRRGAPGHAPGLRCAAAAPATLAAAASAGPDAPLRLGVRARCLKALRGAPRHRLRATLVARFAGQRGLVRLPVTLALARA